MGKWRIPHRDVSDLRQWCNCMLSCVLVEVMTLHRNVNFSCCLLPGSGLSSTRRLMFLINSWVLSGCFTLSWKYSAVHFHWNQLSITKQKFINWTCNCVYNLSSSRFLKAFSPRVNISSIHLQYSLTLLLEFKDESFLFISVGSQCFFLFPKFWFGFGNKTGWRWEGYHRPLLPVSFKVCS